MQVIEVKNNLVRISFEPDKEELILSGFLTIKDENPEQETQFIGQIMHLEANAKGHFAIVKLLFNFDATGVVTSYNGAIPSLRSLACFVPTEHLLGLLPVEVPVVIGELAQQKTVLKLDGSIFEEKLVVCSEREDEKKLLIKNITSQLTNAKQKVLVIDLVGDYDFSQNRVVASENFKLPLNYNTINFIYEKGLDDAKAETKALIQEVFLEVQNYVKTLPEGFIPFESFKNVVDGQYEELGIVELVLLKNKLLKFYEEGIFAQTAGEFDSLKNSLENRETTILDLSKVEEKIQREVISYTYSLIKQTQKEVYVLVNVNNANSDKKLLKQIYTTENAYSTIICSYSYKYLEELKRLARNLILFTPMTQQKDFASYNTFLNKLNSDEFIIYGNATHNLPLIVKLDDTPQQMFEEAAVSEETPNEAVQEVVEEVGPAEEITFEEVPYESQREVYANSQYQEQYPSQDLLDEQIRQDVDKIYTAPKSEQPSQELIIDDLGEDDFNQNFADAFSEAQIELGEQAQKEATEGLITESLTENDLDFIDDLNIIQEEQVGENDFDESFFNEPTETVFEEEPVIRPAAQEEIYEEAFEEDEPSEITASVVREQPPAMDILPAKEASIPSVPIYPAEVESAGFTPEPLEQGDTVVHAKYGKGTVEKMISYGSKTLCSIHFDNVGRRLLDPTLAELKKA